MRHAWQRWLELSRRERLTFVQALFLLPMAGLVLRFGRYQTVISKLEKAAPLKQRQSEVDPLPEAQRAAQMVNAAARRGPYDATCLRRSLVLWWLLRRRRIATDLRIGARIEGGDFSAHAWVEMEGTVLNDAPDVGKRYATFL